MSAVYSSHATGANKGNSMGSPPPRRNRKDDDLLELLILANKSLKKEGIKMVFRKYPVAQLEPKVKKLIGYYPTGEFQIIFEKGVKKISCIRGYASFGHYELLGIEGVNTGDPVRFSEPRNVIKWIKEKLR